MTILTAAPEAATGLGVPIALAQIAGSTAMAADGLDAADVAEAGLPRLAKLAFADGCHASNPRQCTEEDMLALYRASL